MASTGTASADTSSSDEAAQIVTITRNVLSHLEKLDRYDSQELLAYTSTHWMLSTDDFKLPTDPPMGLISNLNPLNESSGVILIPKDDSINQLCYREMHQIIRELTLGIYVLNQTPQIALETNFEQSTSCQLPPAFIDTRIGQLLINVDYMMKCLWHGAYFQKEKRTKFSERWRSNLIVNANGKPETKKPLMTEFSSAGILDITKDPDYATVYDNIPMEQPGDADMAAERRFFMDYVENLTMQMTLYQNKVQHYKNMFIIDSDWLVSSIVKLLDDKIDHTGYERLNTRLQMHELMIKRNLANKAEVHRHLELLKVISFLTPFFMGMRKRMKIPDLSRILPQMGSDECRTERELPPLMLGPDFKCKNFSFGNHYFNLHGGILIDHETDPLEEAPAAFIEQYKKILSTSHSHLKKHLDYEGTMMEHYKIPTFDIEGRTYYAITIEFETYYPTVPQKPLWVRIFHEEILKMKPKKLPINDIHLHEQFKKYFGYKKAIKYKTPHSGLKAAAQRGLVAMFQTLCRKMPPSRLSKQDEHGLSLLHHAAMGNNPQVIAMLLLQSMDVNVRRNNLMSTGPTALHAASRCGAMDSVACLLASFANILATDQDGWAPIHHAAFFNHQGILKLMIRKNEALMELMTKNDLRSTPLLLAASSGGLSAVKCLISLGADITKQDSEGNDMVRLAAMRFHTNILEYLIEWGNPLVPVWKILVGMLDDELMAKKDSAVKCLEVLSTSKPDHWLPILEAGGVPSLVNLLKIENEEIQSVSASVLCNISEHEEIRVALTEATAGPILVTLLASAVDDIQSRASIILSDLACVEGNQNLLAGQGAIAPLIHLLDSELEDVLVNAVNALRVLCTNNTENQNAVAECEGLEPLVEFLTVNSDILQAATSAAIAAITAGNKANQDAVVAEGAVRPLVDLIKGRNITVQVKAASALESLAEHNLDSQKAFLDLDAPKALIRLLKNINVEVREQGACALWSLSGHTKTQQKYIAERTGIPHIIQMLLEPTEKLLYVGCMTAIALGRENIENQNKLSDADAFQQLVRLLRSPKTSQRVLLMVIKVLGILCVGVAYCNNKVTQRRIAEEGAIPILVQILLNPPSEEIQVETAISLGCIILSNPDNQEKLRETPNFKFVVLLDLLKSKDEEIRLRAGMALTIFAFNNTPQQFAIREAGGIRFSVFEGFINSDDEYYECYAAFQVVVLARVIVDQDQVTLTARGVTQLVGKLRSSDENCVVLSASLLSSLAHTRAGINDAMITTGAIELLVDRLASPNDQVRSAVAIALGYLTFNRTATRRLLSSCRNTPGLYNKLMNNIGKNPRISSDFVDEFKRAKIVGLPSQCLEINGGFPIHRDRRPHTAFPRRQRSETRVNDRAVSAPAFVQGRKTIPTIVVKGANDDLVYTKSQSSVSSLRRPVSCISKTSSMKTQSDITFKSNITAWKNEK